MAHRDSPPPDAGDRADARRTLALLRELAAIRREVEAAWVEVSFWRWCWDRLRLSARRKRP